MTATMPDELRTEAKRRRGKVLYDGIFAMPRRRNGQQAVSMKPLAVGDHDSMSYFAVQTHMTLCSAERPGPHRPGEPIACTRARGHDEAHKREGAAQHVVVSVEFIVLETWL